LLAQSFDQATAKVSGEPVQIAQHVAFSTFRRSAQFSVSSTGLLLYGPDPGISLSQLTWYSLDTGLELGRVSDPARITAVALSPDDQHAAATISAGKTSAVTGESALWLFDLVRSASSRLTFAPGSYSFPTWSPDGQYVYFADERPPAPILRKSITGASDVETIYSDGQIHDLEAVTLDGKSLAFAFQKPRDFQIDMLPIEKDTKPAPFVAADSNARGATFSPDGKWMSYLSDETGRYELFVVSFPGHAGKWQISKDGVSDGGWLRTPNTLAYIGNDSKLYLVDVKVNGGQLEIIKTRNVFGGRTLPPTSGPLNPDKLVTRDAKRILLPKVTQAEVLHSLTLVTDWSADLKKP